MNTQATPMEKINKVPFNLIREAEILSQETHLSFRDCLDMVCKASILTPCKGNKSEDTQRRQVG